MNCQLSVKRDMTHNKVTKACSQPLLKLSLMIQVIIVRILVFLAAHGKMFVGCGVEW